MFKTVTRFSVRLVERYLPDSYIFVLIISLIAFVCAVAIEGHSPLAVVRYWGDGFWGLLGFAMQMLLAVFIVEPLINRLMLPAAEALGADLARVAMAVAWGDVWTNLLQPFWALPMLAIAGLRAKDIMGFYLVQLFVTGVIISLGLTFL